MVGDQRTPSDSTDTSSMASNADQEAQNKLPAAAAAAAFELTSQPIAPVRLKKRSTPRPEPLPPSPAESAGPDGDADDDGNCHNDNNASLAQQHSIQVVVRVRPLSKSEIASGEIRPFEECISRCFFMKIVWLREQV